MTKPFSTTLTSHHDKKSAPPPQVMESHHSSTQVKQGFEWKSIEKKPDNSETIRHLIRDAIHSPTTASFTKDKYWENDYVLDCTLEMYPSLTCWIDASEDTATVTKGNKKSSQKAEKIIQKQMMEMIRNDLRKIRIDLSTQRAILVPFTMEITFTIMILVWCISFEIRFQSNAKIDDVAFLDAVISLNRLYDQLSVDYFSSRFRSAYEKALGSMNQRIDATRHYPILFDNPYLLVQSMADRRPQSHRLYKEQHETLDQVVRAVHSNDALLLGNQMPTGTGKSFLSIPLAVRLHHEKCKKTVLFICSNELVNKDVASSALLADDLHLWLARLVRSETDQSIQVLLRPYKRCFPAVWKKVYKKDDSKKMGSIQDQWTFYKEATRRQPDLIIADVEAGRELLRAASTIGDPFVAYVDEFIADEVSNRVMKDIAQWLPRQSVILSAILPQFHEMPDFVKHFCHRHQTTADHAIHRVATAVVNISCAIIDPEGCLRMPHHEVSSTDDMKLLLMDIQNNPRIRRAYTVKHTYGWAQDLMRAHVLPSHLFFDVVFPNIGKIQNVAILDYAIALLTHLRDHFDELPIFQRYRPRVLSESAHLKDIMTRQAHMYDDDKTLVIAQDIYRTMIRASETLLDADIKWEDIVKMVDMRQKEKDHRLQQCDAQSTQRGQRENMKLGKSVRLDAMDIRMKREAIMEEIDTRLQIPLRYVINSIPHAQRFAPPGVTLHHPRPAITLTEEYDYAFDPQFNLLLSAGVGIYDVDHMTIYQRRLVMELYDLLAFLCSGKEIVFGTNLPSLTTIFIDASFGDVEHPNVLYQLMGRAGRMGRSYHANIITNSWTTVKKVLSFHDYGVDASVVAFNNAFVM